MKKLFPIILTVLLPLLAVAQDVQFKASAPQQVILGKPFQLTYSINQRAKDLRAPQMQGFDILAGPYTSTSSSTQWINGQRTSTFTQTYTYTIAAQAEGDYTIQPATIRVDGEQYQSNGLKIKVLPPDQSNDQRPTANDQRPTTNDQQTSANDIFIRTIVSKTKVHEQECISLQYKLYFAGVDVTQFTNNTKLPEFKGFLKQDIDQSEIQTQLEHYNGRNYQTAVLYRTLLYPQHAGDITIEPASFEAVIRVQNRAQVRSIFDDFFGSYTNVTKTISTNSTRIHVDPLPANKPAAFSGAVGKFTINSKISNTQLQTNDALTIKLDINGTGNLKLIKTPTLNFPEGFEPYDPKVSNNFKTTAQGFSGTKSIEYLAIARAVGDYTIPPITFAYYDPQENTYKTLQTPAYEIHVARGADDQAIVQSSFVGKEDIKQINTDIRYIYTAKLPKLQSKSILNIFNFGSTLFILAYILPIGIFILLFIIFRKRIRENADQMNVRFKKANKVAQKRLKKAKQLLSQSNYNAFYEEIERALYQYLADKLSIPNAQLNKDNIDSSLQEKQVPQDIRDLVRQVLETAEFARYAPAAEPNQQMQQLYDTTTQLINQLESIKK